MYSRLFLDPCRGAIAAVYLLASAAAFSAESKQVTRLEARHAAGQTLLTFAEVDPAVRQERIAATKIQESRRRQDQSTQVCYRIYRSESPIRSVAGLEPVAEVPQLSGWNIDYFGDLRPEQEALRYVVDEDCGPVPPGTGICVVDGLP